MNFKIIECMFTFDVQICDIKPNFHCTLVYWLHR